MSLVTNVAPNFVSSAVLGDGNIISDFNFYKYVGNSMSILFFWPMDFTFVCPSELIALNNRFDLFKNRNVKIIGVSCDSEFVHYFWRNTPINQGGLGSVKFVMVSDKNHKIQNLYSVKHKSLGISLRATFIIDSNFVVRSQMINDLSLGRNIDEIIRIIDAIKHSDVYGDVCPAQWEQGKDTLKPSFKSLKKFLTTNYVKI